jgi:pilus assembly protein CpaE
LALRHPDDVLLIDTSLQIGTCAMLLDLKPTTSIVDAIRERDRLDKTLLRHLTLRHGSGLRLLARPSTRSRGRGGRRGDRRIINMARRSFKYVVVDTLSDAGQRADDDSRREPTPLRRGAGWRPAVAGVARLLPVLEGLGFLSPGSAGAELQLQAVSRQPQPATSRNRLQRTIDYVVPYERAC